MLLRFPSIIKTSALLAIKDDSMLTTCHVARVLTTRNTGAEWVMAQIEADLKRSALAVRVHARRDASQVVLLVSLVWRSCVASSL